MKTKTDVHILVTVRKPELLSAALLVFKTLRVGFPSASVMVWGNQLDFKSEDAVTAAVQSVGGRFANIARTTHDAWIESLLLESLTPFWICDTDVVFWRNLECRMPNAECRLEFAGRFEPAFEEAYTGCEHVERLHTCVMYIDPVATRVAIRQVMSPIPELWRNQAQFLLTRQHYVPRRNRVMILYDTMAGLYQAGFGTAFSEAENDCFDHLHCGSYSDDVGPALGEPDLMAKHQAICANPPLVRGLRKFQDESYQRLRPKTQEAPHGLCR